MHINKPKLSIVIATYNAESCINNAINSVLSQSYKEWECIIVDGKSVDNTISIVTDFVEKDSRIKYISEPDTGIYDAFNKGWKIAQGEWIYYLGADDVLLQNGFEHIFQQSQIQMLDICYANVVYRTPLGLNYVKSEKNPDNIRKRLNCSHQGFMMRRDIIGKEGGFDNLNYRISADYDLILRSYLNGARMHYIDIDLSIFDVSGVSSSINMAMECFRIRKRNKSINIFNNYILLFKEIILFYLRKTKYLIMGI